MAVCAETEVALVSAHQRTTEHLKNCITLLPPYTQSYY